MPCAWAIKSSLTVVSLCGLPSISPMRIISRRRSSSSINAKVNASVAFDFNADSWSVSLCLLSLIPRSIFCSFSGEAVPPPAKPTMPPLAIPTIPPSFFIICETPYAPRPSDAMLDAVDGAAVNCCCVACPRGTPRSMSDMNAKFCCGAPRCVKKSWYCCVSFCCSNCCCCAPAIPCACIAPSCWLNCCCPSEPNWPAPCSA